MIYSTGTISLNGNVATGNGSSWTDSAAQVRAGQTLIVLSTPVQIFQISAVNSATQLTVTPAASLTVSGQKYGILVSDAMSVDGLAQSMSQLIQEYDENIGAWETFALTAATQDIPVTINGQNVTIPSLGKLKSDIDSKADKTALDGKADKTALDGKADKVDGSVPVAQGGTGATNAEGARTKLGVGDKNVPLFASLELSSPTPYIDFHLNNTTADYNVRIMNTADRTLTLAAIGANPAVNLNGISHLMGQYINVSSPVSNAIAQLPGGHFDHAGTRTRLLNQPGAASGGFDLIILNANGSAKCTFNLNADGGIGGPFGGVVWQGSDQALKYNIEDVDGGEDAALARLLKIRPREFEWNNNGKRDRGFIAQEMLAIDERYANYSFKTYDTGNDANDLSGKEEGVYGLSDRAIMADVIAVIQMQQRNIEALKSNLEELKKIVDGHLVE